MSNFFNNFLNSVKHVQRAVALDFQDKRVLLTRGMGFIDSNLVILLLGAGAEEFEL